MEEMQRGTAPTQCPVCEHELYITRLQCPRCATEVNGFFVLRRLASLPEPHATLIEQFLRLRGNVKDMERELGLSYPTVRARLEEALNAAGFGKGPGPSDEELAAHRSGILDALERGEITAADAAAHLRELKMRRNP